MAYPRNNWLDGEVPTAADLNAISNALRIRPGDLDGGAYAVTNSGDLTFAAGKGITQDAWTALTLENAWVNYAGGYPAASYRVGKDKTCRLKGTIKGGVAADGTILFTLPVGARPIASHSVAVAGANAAGTSAVGMSLGFGADGTVRTYGAQSNAYIHLVCSIPLD